MSSSTAESSGPTLAQPIDLFGTVFCLHDRGEALSSTWAGLSSSGSDGMWTAAAVRFDNDQSVHADVWERHPVGEEVLCVFSGVISVYLRDAGPDPVVTLAAGHSFIVPRDQWHRLSVVEPGHGVGIVIRTGTRHEPVSHGTAPQSGKEH